MHYLRQLPVDLAFVTLQRLLDSLPDLVLIVVEQQLGEGGDVGQGEDGAEDLETSIGGLSLLSFESFLSGSTLLVTSSFSASFVSAFVSAIDFFSSFLLCPGLSAADLSGMITFLGAFLTRGSSD